MEKNNKVYIIVWSKTGLPDEDFCSTTLEGKSLDFIKGFVAALDHIEYKKVFYADITKKV